MSALFQAVTTQLGNLGGSYATARDEAAQQHNRVIAEQAALNAQSQRLAEEKRMNDLTTRVQTALLNKEQNGTWKPIGQPLLKAGGGYSVTEYNDATGAIRSRDLPPGTSMSNSDQAGWEEYKTAYKQAFGTDPPADVQKAFFNKLAGVPPQKQTDFEAWQEAFTKQHGRAPNASEIAGWHRNPIVVGGSDDELASFAQGLASKQLTIAQVPSKLRGSVLRYAQQNGIKFNNLNATVENNLLGKDAALENLLGVIQDIRPLLPLLQSLPNAALVDLAQHSDTAAALLTRMFPDKGEQVDRLAGDLRSMQEAINVIRAPLGATGFRSKEAWEALQRQTLIPLGNAQINAVTLARSEQFARNLLDATNQVLQGGEIGAPPPTITPGAGAQPPATPAPPKFVRDPKTGEMVEQ